MARNFEDLDIELFIGEIRNYPEIWNVASENYHDRLKKRGAWISVCRVLFEGLQPTFPVVVWKVLRLNLFCNFFSKFVK
jgi:hypothetical protein